MTAAPVIAAMRAVALMLAVLIPKKGANTEC
ncbi:MAG: hypothetical protein ACJAYW_001529, partial [Candidatus Azotimanducaceae bacterium]